MRSVKKYKILSFLEKEKILERKYFIKKLIRISYFTCRAYILKNNLFQLNIATASSTPFSTNSCNMLLHNNFNLSL